MARVNVSIEDDALDALVVGYLTDVLDSHEDLPEHTRDENHDRFALAFYRVIEYLTPPKGEPYG